MKTPISINVDTLEFSICDQPDSFKLPNSKIVTVVNPDGEIADRYQNRVTIPGKHGAHALNVRALHSGKQLYVEGSPYAFLHGQNVFTGSDLKKTIAKVLNKILKHLNISAIDDQRQRWPSTDISVHRADIAVNFMLNSEEECHAVLQQIKRQLIEQYGSMKAYGTSAYWTPRDGKEYSIAFYAKGPQLRRQKRRYANLPCRERLLVGCRFILRVEIRLREPALKKMKLQKVSDWNEQSARRVFCRYMRRLKIFSITSGPLSKRELDALPASRLRPVLALHKLGADLSLAYSPSTLRRHQSKFRKLGIDLKVPNQPRSTVLPLTKILSPKRAMKGAPAWMVRSGLAPSPAPAPLKTNQPCSRSAHLKHTRESFKSQSASDNQRFR